MKKDKIISALIALIGACNNNPKTPNTDNVVIKALAFSAPDLEQYDSKVSQMVTEIYSEKNAVAPGCAKCVAPCGNTSDYDMSRIYEAADDVRDIKLRILLKLQNLAAYIYHGQESEEKRKIDNEFFYRALSYISYDVELMTLHDILKEAEKLEFEINIRKDRKQ